MSSSPYEIQQRLLHAQQVLEEVDRAYNTEVFYDIEVAIAKYTNVLILYRGIYEDSNASLGQDDESTILALAMVGVITARIGQVYQQLDLNFEESFKYLFEGYKILKECVERYPRPPLSQWIYQQINWCLGLLAPIRDDEYDTQDPDTWKFKYPRSDYLAEVGLTYSNLASRRMFRSVGEIYSIYTQTLQGSVITRDSYGYEIPATPRIVIPSLAEHINAMMYEVDRMKTLVKRLKNETLPPERRETLHQILGLYNFSLSQVRSIAELLYQYLYALPDETRQRLEKYLPRKALIKFSSKFLKHKKARHHH